MIEYNREVALNPWVEKIMYLCKHADSLILIVVCKGHASMTNVYTPKKITNLKTNCIAQIH